MNDIPKQKLPYPLHISDELRSQLEIEANRTGRSLRAEIIARLQDSLIKRTNVYELSWLELISLLDKISDERRTPISISIDSSKK